MNNVRDASRLRLGLNPLLTQSLGGSYQQQNVPHSAIPLGSNTQYPVQTPASAIQPYNPQEWVASPAVGPERAHSFHHEHQHHQQHQQHQPLSPPPPPPYSPPRSQRPISQAFESPTANTSAPRIPPSNAVSHRPSPDPPANTSFPPPPGAPSRGMSRERRFGLPSLGRRRDYDQSQNIDQMLPRNPGPNLTINVPPQHEPPRFISSPANAAPPNARRAASVGVIDTPTSARSRSTSQVRWEPGMPVPPPPPGPPPSQSRSQSLQPVDRTNVPVASPPTRRPPPNGVTALGPVPPTPANWVDEDAQQSEPSRGRSPTLTIDTSSAHSSSNAQEDSSGSSSSGGLARTRAVRHDKTIIQRRAESKTRGPSGGSKELSDIVVPNSNTLSRRLTITKSTPRSAGRASFEAGETSSHSIRNPTPRALGTPHLQQGETATPPFSPRGSRANPAVEASPGNIPKSQPTPPPRAQSRSSDDRASLATPAESLRPPPSGASIPPTRQDVVMQSSEQFNRETIDRVKLFAMREAAAETDADRVRLFADFIVSESRIRRERYAGAIAAMGSEIFDLTRDLFRPMDSRRQSGQSWAGGEWTPQSSEPNRSHRGSFGYQDGATPGSAPVSAGIGSSPAGTPTNANWGGNNNYMPSLSPILSMSNVDDADSRGRPASRWWEADSTGAPDRTLERSKRESKYMGVPKEAREALQWLESPKRTEPGMPNDTGSPDEYPAEKTGFHDLDGLRTPQALRHSVLTIQSASSHPSTPSAVYLDISRLVTLPPPYPRHHPAVNNNHPDLQEIRTEVRTLSDLAQVAEAKEQFRKDSERRREELKKRVSERRKALRLNLQEEISSGNMSYAEAAAIDADATEAEKDETKELEKTDFEEFQRQVVAPTNELLTGHIARATQLLEDLSSRLFDDVESAADMPQEEGDDKPELLEKLTLLKWVFEAREALHKALYDLLSARNDAYKAVITTPYRLSGNSEKLEGAEAFFRDDTARRAYAFAAEVLQRTEAFEKVVADNVSRGVEVQLSAFWDIAPNISGLLERVPDDLAGLRVQIPAAEYEETPAYREHPLQYLFSLVLHAEKSTYQFIESQTNLLCLLHEVREAVTNAKARLIETEVDEQGNADPAGDREARAERLRQEDARRLGDDLKEKVRVVQGQWGDSLGGAIKLVKERVGGWLLETGGWDEQLEDNGVGVA